MRDRTDCQHVNIADNPQRRAGLPALTSLRFFAALMVVLCHLQFLRQSSDSTINWVVNNIVKEGFIGVAFFFTLSGFILSESYSQRLAAKSTSLRTFYVARLARIAPLHLLMLLISLPLIFLDPWSKINAELIFRLISNVTLTQAFAPRHDWYYGFNAPSWSLSVELLFYTIFPFLVTTRTRVLATLVVVVISAKVGLGFIVDAKNTEFVQYVFPPLRTADFVIGILLHRLFERAGVILTSYATVMQVAAVGLLAIFVGLSTVIPEWVRFDIYYIAPMSLLVFVFAFNTGRFAQAISGQAMILLGEASFALYMVHYLVIRYGETVLARIGMNRSALFDLGVAFVYIIISASFALLLFKKFEGSAKHWVIAKLSPEHRVASRSFTESAL